MTKYQWSILCAVLLIMISPGMVDAGKQSKPTGGQLMGSWQCQGRSGTSSLIFESKNRLVFNGEASNYRLVRGAIRVQGDYGPVDYRYSLKGSRLMVIFPDGSQLQCLKTAPARTGGGKRGGADKAGGGKASQLRGMLCSWGGSSSSSSSYSRSTRVVFDGRGGFRYSSESSFSGGAGGAYGSSPTSSGTYRVAGNTVYLTFSDGSTAKAQVKMRQSNGSITELMYRGQLYATGLCN
jgi:hypothetical protein